METPAQQCARELLNSIPLVMRFIRSQVRQCRRAGLSLPQFRTLAVLSSTDHVSLSLAAEFLGLSLPAASRLIDILVRDRLVVRQTVAHNRRQIALTLTPAGRVKLELIRGQIRRRLTAILRTVPVREQKEVRDAMRVLHRVFGVPPVAASGRRKP